MISAVAVLLTLTRFGFGIRLPVNTSPFQPESSKAFAILNEKEISSASHSNKFTISAVKEYCQHCKYTTLKRRP